MPPLSEDRQRKLQTILQRENSKTGTINGRAPAVFRETWGDTHKTMPAEYFGPPIIDGVVRTSTVPVAGRRSQSSRRAADQGGLTNAALTGQPVEFRSVFQPTAEQEHVCSLARERRQRVQGSEWALLDTLETAMYMDERDYRQRMNKELQAQQRRALDTQVARLEAQKAAEARDVVRERELVLEQIAASKEEEKLLAQVDALKQAKLREERRQIAARAATEKAKATARNQAQEERIMREAERQLEEERKKLAAKAEEARANAARQREENEMRMAARKENEAQMKAMDEALMRETMKTLEKQEKAREEHMRAFREKAQARTAMAGNRAAEESKEREERADRLAKLFEEQKEREAAERERQQQERKEKQKTELVQAHEVATRIKAMKAAEQREQQRKEREEAEWRAKLEKEGEEAKQRAIRERTMANTDFLKTQMTTREALNVTDDTGMTEAEKRLNLRLLEQAVNLVGPVPQQLAVKW